MVAGAALSAVEAAAALSLVAADSFNKAVAAQSPAHIAAATATADTAMIKAAASAAAYASAAITAAKCAATVMSDCAAWADAFPGSACLAAWTHTHSVTAHSFQSKLSEALATAVDYSAQSKDPTARDAAVAAAAALVAAAALTGQPASAVHAQVGSSTSGPRDAALKRNLQASDCHSFAQTVWAVDSLSSIAQRGWRGVQEMRGPSSEARHGPQVRYRRHKGHSRSQISTDCNDPGQLKARVQVASCVRCCAHPILSRT